MIKDEKLLYADGFTYSAEPCDIVMQLLKIAMPRTAIDVGAGAGRNVSLLLQHDCAVTAVECGTESLEILRDMATRYPKLHVMQSTLQSLNVREQFDAVLCNMTLHFLQADEIADAVSTLQSLTKPVGFACISSYVDCPENDSLPAIYTYKLASEELKNYFSGWKIHSYVEEYPVPTLRLKNSGINDGKGYISARLVAEKI